MEFPSMPKSESIPTTDPSEPTTAQMDDMWLASPRPELSSWTEAETAAHYRSVALHRRAAMAIMGEAA
jgi:hypothetical protein